MKVYLHELSDLEKELSFTQEEKWVLDSVEAVDEESHDSSPAVSELLRNPSRSKAPQPRNVRADFSLRKVDEVVIATGDYDTSIRLICSRCASYFSFAAKHHFSALFCKDPVMAGVGYLNQKASKPGGQNRGWARHAASPESDESSTEVTQDLDITYISNDFIDLSAVLTEQLQLQIPFQPLCKESCKGMCSQCGADWNTGRCACKQIAKNNPFSVLKEMENGRT
ncbi:DUF177 domain-containing protein [bacterium]|jgi:uncharacterized protein|nr:DUF177 domain-containing protein [bacterium]